jgi:hypothetical protein
LVVIVVIEIEENIMYLLLYPRNIYPKTLFQNIYPKTPMHKPCVLDTEKKPFSLEDHSTGRK